MSAEFSVPLVQVTSRDNPLLKTLRRLSQEPTGYRKVGQIWLEGDHLCRAALLKGLQPAFAVFSASYWPLVTAEYGDVAIKNIVVADSLWADISGLESPAQMGFVMNMAPAATLDPGAATVVLDRVQDAGNVGSILRSAAVFGFGQVLALKGTAALWSPKVIRAGMGAHFALHLLEGLAPASLSGLQVPVVVTSSHAGASLHQQQIPMPCAWVMGHEGQGVSEELMVLAKATGLTVRIDQPGGEESLNVGAAAAICLYASAVGRARSSF